MLKYKTRWKYSSWYWFGTLHLKAFWFRDPWTSDVRPSISDSIHPKRHPQNESSVEVSESVKSASRLVAMKLFRPLKLTETWWLLRCHPSYCTLYRFHWNLTKVQTYPRDNTCCHRPCSCRRYHQLEAVCGYCSSSLFSRWKLKNKSLTSVEHSLLEACGWPSILCHNIQNKDDFDRPSPPWARSYRNVLDKFWCKPSSLPYYKGIASPRFPSRCGHNRIQRRIRWCLLSHMMCRYSLPRDPHESDMA